MEVNVFSIEAELCIAFDNASEWIPEAALSVDGRSVEAERCMRFTFPRLREWGANTEMLLVVESITADAFGRMREEDCAAARAAIQASQPEIDFVCHIVEERGGLASVLK